MKKKVGKPRKGKEIRVSTSIRIEPSIRNYLIEKFGSLSEAIHKLAKMIMDDKGYK